MFGLDEMNQRRWYGQDTIRPEDPPAPNITPAAPPEKPFLSEADKGSLTEAGLAAAASAAKAIANAAAEKARSDQQIALNKAQRDHQAKLAKMRLSAAGEGFDKNNEAGAYDSIINALSHRSSTARDSRDIRQKSNLSMEQLFATALLRGQ